MNAMKRTLGGMAEGPEFPKGSQRIKVLVVDDDENMISTLSRMLRRDAEITTAHSGEEALAQLERVEFDAVLCDMSMEGMSGRQVWDTIRREAPELAERIVFMSGGPITAEDEAFFDSMAERLLAKPFRRAELVAALQRFGRR